MNIENNNPGLFKSPINKQNDINQSQLKTDKKIKADADNFILCSQCLQIITHPSEQIVVDGFHQHTFANPHGIIFDIGCFRSAIGCGYLGTPSDEFSWFKGFSWRVAVCSSCLMHIGWLFSSTDKSSFLGLILERLIESGS